MGISSGKGYTGGVTGGPFSRGKRTLRQSLFRFSDMVPVLPKNGEPFYAHCKPTPGFSRIFPLAISLPVKRQRAGSRENRKYQVARIFLQILNVNVENLANTFPGRETNLEWLRLGRRALTPKNPLFLPVGVEMAVD